MVPTSDSGNGVVWLGSPDEGFWIVVCLCDEAIDGSLKVVEGSEDATLEPASRELGKEPLDGVESGSRSRGEVEGPPGVTREPFAHLRVLMSGR